MARSINFVQSRQKKISQLTKQDAKLRMISIGTVSVSFVLFLITIVLRLFNQQVLTTLENREDSVKQSIIRQEGIEKNYTLFVYKLQTLTQLFEQRKGKQEAISYFNTVFGENVLVREIRYSAENQKVSFTIQAKDVFTLESVYSVFKSEAFMQQYPVVEKAGLRRESSGSYVMDVSVLLDTVAKK